jgi:hypothetical protein
MRFSNGRMFDQILLRHFEFEPIFCRSRNFAGSEGSRAALFLKRIDAGAAMSVERYALRRAP